MAWRIHQSVIRGEVDNRERGVVRGTIWLKGLAEPLVLDLKGNASPDLAGCQLTFENAGEIVALEKDQAVTPLQCGTVGDFTASRKVRVYDIPDDEVWEWEAKNKPIPEHLANCVYLEWFSESNGRVVIESTDYRVTISPPSWRLSPEDESKRKEQAAEGLTGFLSKLDKAPIGSGQVSEDKEWNEFDYEKLMRETDTRTEKYGDLFEKYKDHPDRDRIIAREMGWSKVEEKLDAESATGTPAANEEEPAVEASEEESALDFDEEEGQVEPDPAAEGVDWVRDHNGDICHPLCHRAHEATIALWCRLAELGLKDTQDADVRALRECFHMTSCKLAGALNGFSRGYAGIEAAFIIAYLKRALVPLHSAQAALERVAVKNLIPTSVVEALRGELFAIREEILRLNQEFRGNR